jgi:hypothetical protein
VDPPIKSRFFRDERNQIEEREHSFTLQSQPFQGGFENFLSPLEFLSLNTQQKHGPDRLSMFDDLIYYWTEKLPPSFDTINPNLLSLFYYPLRIVAAEWMNFVNFLHYTVDNHEYFGEFSFQHLDNFQSNLLSLQSWRRSSLGSLVKVRAVTNFLSSHCATVPPSAIWSSLMTDYMHIATHIELYSRRLQDMIPVITSLGQIIESRQSFTETRNIGRLTYLALVFVPLTYVSSIFSMTGDTAPGRKFFWVYFAVAIPMLAVVFLVARPPRKAIFSLLEYLGCGRVAWMEKAGSREQGSSMV